MTPDELREWADRCGNVAHAWDYCPAVTGGECNCPRGLTLAASAAADAWEADRQTIDTQAVHYGDVIASLRKRLEEAEKAMLDAARKLRDYETSDDELDEVADRLAALAGEET